LYDYLNEEFADFSQQVTSDLKF